MNVFEIGAKIGLDSKAFVNGLNSASGAVSSFASKTKDVLGGVAKVATASLGAASAGIGALAKQAVSAYADYEQLAGGVEKLFGESADLLQAYAKEAYKTAGLSVNEYMEIATSFSAALISSVQAAGMSMDEAVELADTAMQDMSDNANTFGTDIANIQTAYQGFAKQNYTMLDNLKLGYGGTKAEMERLIEDANKLRHEQGINNDLTIESYGDIISAIHTVQVQMGIYNTTEKEAAKTISGSINMTKAAWKNLVTEMGKSDGDIAGAFNTLQESVAAVGSNILPRVEQTLSGISDLITASAPQITRAITKLLPKILPQVIKSAGQLVSGIGTTLLESIPELLDTGRNLLANLTYGMVTADVDGTGILGNILDSILNQAPYYMQYAQMIVSYLADKLLNVDYSRVGSALHDIIINGINSLTDFVTGIDFNKVGEDIANFLNAVDFIDIAQHIFDLIAEGVKQLPKLAQSFFDNANIGNLMAAIALLGAPKLIGGITTFMQGSEGQALGKEAGKSWSSAFMLGIEAFGLGWTIGTYLRDNIKIGDKTLGEWVDQSTSDILDTIGENKILSKTAIGRTVNEIKAYEKEMDYTDRFVTAKMPDGSYAEIIGRNADGTLNEAGRKYGITVDWQTADHNAIGNYINKPTLTWAGENEPEYIIPESKMDKVYSRGGEIHIDRVELNINGTFDMANPEDRHKLIEEFSTELQNLSISQQRAVGGKTWA